MKLFPDEAMSTPDESKIQQVIFAGQAYMAHNIPTKTPVFGLFFEQVKYISPLLWLAQFAAIFFVIATAISGEPGLLRAQGILLRVAPLAAIFAVPELVKDILFGMAELENSCKNSGAKMLLMRLVAIGCMNLIALCLLAALLAGVWQERFLSLVLYALAPYNCVIALNLAIIQLLKIRSRGAALAASILSAAVVWLPASRIAISAPVMLAIFIATTLILAIEMLKLFQSMPKGGRLVWN